MQDYAVRKFKDKLAYILGLICVVIAIIPLGSILIEVIRNGLPALNLEFLTQTPGAVGQPGGGIGPAIEGTLILIGLTCLIGVPLGLLSGIYLAEFGDNKFGKIVRFVNDVIAEFPSIVIGIFAYLVFVLTIGSFSPIAGAAALSIIMLPIITRTTEESLKLVPNTIREASMALGVRRWKTTISVVISSAKSGIVTGIMLSVARIAGETAPLIMTILGSQWFFSGKIVEKRFIGRHVDYFVESEGASINIRLLRIEDPSFNLGDNVYFHIDKENVLVYRYPEEGLEAAFRLE